MVALGRHEHQGDTGGQRPRPPRRIAALATAATVLPASTRARRPRRPRRVRPPIKGGHPPGTSQRAACAAGTSLECSVGPDRGSGATRPATRSSDPQRSGPANRGTQRGDGHRAGIVLVGLVDLPEPGSRTPAARLGGTSSTRSPAASSCCASSCPSPRAPAAASGSPCLAALPHESLSIHLSDRGSTSQSSLPHPERRSLPLNSPAQLAHPSMTHQAQRPPVRYQTAACDRTTLVHVVGNQCAALVR